MTYDELVNFLVNCRTIRGWPRAVLAKKMHTSERQIIRMETGEVTAKVATLNRWARVFGIDIRFDVRSRE